MPSVLRDALLSWSVLGIDGVVKPRRGVRNDARSRCQTGRRPGAVELPAARQKCRSRVRPVEAPIDDTPPAPARAVHSRRLGRARRRRDDNAIERASTPVWHALMRALAACASRRQRALCRAARRADGQFRGRPHQSRRRPGRHAGSAAHRRRRSPTGQLGATAGACATSSPS